MDHVFILSPITMAQTMQCSDWSGLCQTPINFSSSPIVCYISSFIQLLGGSCLDLPS